MPTILDASTLVAFLLLEPGHEKAAEFLRAGALACTVNLSKAIAVLLRHGAQPDAAVRAVHSLPVEWIDFDQDLARRAALMQPLTKKLGLAFGDRACLAAGIRQNCPVVTADRAWRQLPPALGVTVELIRHTTDPQQSP